MRRIKYYLTTATLLTILGCGGGGSHGPLPNIENPDDGSGGGNSGNDDGSGGNGGGAGGGQVELGEIIFRLGPLRPNLGEEITFTTKNATSLDTGDGASYSFSVEEASVESNTVTAYTQPGKYKIVASNEKDSKEDKVYVRPFKEFFGITDSVEEYLAEPAFIPEEDWRDIIMPNLDPATTAEIEPLDVLLTTTKGRLLRRTDLLYLVNSDENFVGLTDSDGDGQKDYVGRRELSSEAVTTIDTFLNATLQGNDAMSIISQTRPKGQPRDLNPTSGTLVVLGNEVYCDMILEYTEGQRQVTIGVLYGEHSQSDIDAVDTFREKYRDRDRYVNWSFVIMNETSEYKIRKTMSDEYSYHKENN